MSYSGLSGGSNPPKYCRQKRKGKPDAAFCKVNGRRVYLGIHGSAKSRSKYAELISGGHHADDTCLPTPSTDPTVTELIAGYLDFACTYYRKPDGTVTRGYGHTCEAMKYLRRVAGEELAESIGPKRIKLIRQEMIDRGLSRGHINAQVKRIVRMFRWGIEEEMVPPTVYQALAAIQNLQPGRRRARTYSPFPSQ